MEQLSLCAKQLTLRSRACESQLLSPRATTTEALQEEKPVQWKVASCPLQPEKAQAAMKTQYSQK